MKTNLFVSLLSIACAAVAMAGSKEASQLQIYPKNLARHHIGANLFTFNPATQTYSPTEASAAWLDDDITTGSPILAGQQHYLLALPEPELLMNFSISTRPTAGTVTLYAGDEPAAPGAKSWTVIAKDIPIEKVNEHKLSKPFSRVAKYLLIETKAENPSPVFSLYVYGDKPAVAYNMTKREQGIDTRAIFGPHVNEQTALNVAGLYTGSVVSHANAGDGFVSWQKAVDDNPESATTLTPSNDQPGATVKYSEPRNVSRIALLTDSGAKGKLDFFLVEQGDNSGAQATPTPIGERAPTASLSLDGTNARQAIEFPQTKGSEMLVRWTPSNGTDSIRLRELEVFGDPALSTYAVNMTPEAVAEGRMADKSKDGKTFKDVKDVAAIGEEAPPIGEFLPQSRPYLPGALGFPPNVTLLAPTTPTVVSAAESPVSP